MRMMNRTVTILALCIGFSAVAGCAAKVDDAAIIRAGEPPAAVSSSISTQELAGYYPSIKTVSGTEAIVAFYKTHEDSTNGEPPAAAATVVEDSQGNWKPK